MAEQLHTSDETPTTSPEVVQGLGSLTVGEFPASWEEYQTPESVLMYATD